MSIQENLQALGLELPHVVAPVGSYIPWTVAGDLIFTSGQLPVRGGVMVATGQVPTSTSLELAHEAARQAAINALAILAAAAGSLDKIKRIVRLNVFVNSAPGFIEQAKVANGASELLTQVLGEAGKHSRCAIGAAELPLNASVELDIIAEISR
jgi:enamine deaminase RidA (YjgF/YER057c/UK114 family)